MGFLLILIRVLLYCSYQSFFMGKWVSLTKNYIHVFSCFPSEKNDKVPQVDVNKKAIKQPQL